MLASMTTELQMQHETVEAYDTIIHLRELFEKHARFERYEISKLLFSTKMQVRTSLVQHALKMNTYIERLGKLGFVMDHELSIDLIMSNLTDNFAQIMLNYHMQSKETKTMMLVDSSASKKSSKNNNKKKMPMKAKGGVTKKKVKEASPKGAYFHCGQDGHSKRNCKAYLGSLKKKALNAPSTSVMFVIEVNTISNNN